MPATEPADSSTNARPSAARSTCFRRAPSAMRIPSSRSRLLTVYEAMPKMPVTASIAPSSPSTPSATRGHPRGKQRRTPSPRFQVLTIERQPRVQPVQRALQRPGNLLRIAVRPHQQPGVARLLLQEREEHRRLLILGQRPVFPVFHHAHHFRPRSAPELEMPADGLVHRPENLHAQIAGSPALPSAPCCSSCQLRSLPASSVVPAAAR